jgi:hypothetical protein
VVGALAESQLPMGGVIPTSTRLEWPAGVGGAAFACGVVGVTSPSRCPGVAEPLSDWSPVGLSNPPVVAVVMTLRSVREVRLESAVARVASPRVRGPASDAEPVPTGTTETEAPFGSVVDAIVTASAAFAQTPQANALAVTNRAKN